MISSGPPVRSYFNARASNYESGNWQSRGLFPQEINAINDLPFDLDIAIDIGSGPGRPVSILADHARHVIAVDTSLEMLRLRKHRQTVILADGYKLPIRANVADVLYMRMSMHYFKLSCISMELHRVLRSGGRLYIVSILPYGLSDEEWFNERHHLKGKANAYTPCKTRVVEALSPSLTLESTETWNTVHSVQAASRSNPAADHANLARHALDAPPDIRQLYNITRNENGDISTTVSWAILKFVK